MPIASLGMYDQPFLQPSNDLLWQAIRHSITNIESAIDVPCELNRTMSLADQWRNPELLLSQTCGFPYISRFREYLQLVATPVYSHSGCNNTSYSSVLLSSNGASKQLADFRGKKLAANSPDSLSGFVSLQITLAEAGLKAPFFSQCAFCDSHANAIDSVASGQADLCCIDAVTWNLLCSDQPVLAEQLQVIGHTGHFPALPLVTSVQTSPQTVNVIREALDAVCEEPKAKPALSKLGISGFTQVAHSEYQMILDRYQQIDTSPIADSITTNA